MNAESIQHNDVIDEIKGASIIMIVIYHYFFRFQEIYGFPMIGELIVSKLGAIGVAFFFLISG